MTTVRMQMNRAWLIVGITLLVAGCDARKLLGDSFSVQKSCEATHPDCVFQSAAGTTQQICEPTTGQCRQCGKGADSMSSFDLVSGTKECRDGYKKGLICDSTKFECRSCQSINQECAKADPAYPVCNAGVCTDRNGGAMSRCTLVHGAELVDVKQLACPSYALLAKERRAG